MVIVNVAWRVKIVPLVFGGQIQFIFGVIHLFSVFMLKISILIFGYSNIPSIESTNILQ